VVASGPLLFVPGVFKSFPKEGIQCKKN
jgi:hypothetical protein